MHCLLRTVQLFLRLNQDYTNDSRLELQSFAWTDLIELIYERVESFEPLVAR